MIIQMTDQIRDSIRNLRKSKGVRGDDLSKAVNKSPSYISRIENGKTVTIEDSTLFSVFQNLLGQDEESVQEYMDMFINQVPVFDDFSNRVSSLSNIKQTILNDFIDCLANPENSDQFTKSVVDAISLSSQAESPSTVDMFTATLAQMMRTWKQRRKVEEEIYSDMLKSLR
ncbi:MAG: helix-turn-helix transcriptional regulator [Phoenicibacter congonensis]|uniref:Helix-turn-helix transcriptional regulator n=1 Tax=Phoenicibacter congonensis TaxID=1944646 RepID=A0AA43RL83_9ACTN|nr:helix-turn-helix transcriptional regulator [Phoenicibacter congonensis]